MSAIIGNSAAGQIWGILSAVGVSSLILAPQVAHRRSWRTDPDRPALVVAEAPRDKELEHKPRRRAGWRSGLVTSVSNPKLAVFFVTLFPQFLNPGSPGFGIRLATESR